VCAVTAVLLALLSALCYGTSDFVGGVLSTRVPPWTVALCAQVGGAAAVAVVALLGGDPGLSVASAGWACLAGAGSGLGTAFLYRGLAAGRMGVVAPVSGVGSAVVPVLVGVVAGGERPAALVWLGIVLALPAIYLVARTTGGGGSAGVLDGALAGIGFGASFAAIAQVPAGSGLWPLAVNQLVAAVLLIGGATLARSAWLPRERQAAYAVVAGVLAAAALGVFLAATRHGYLTVTSVIAALYPAATVLLAATVLRERIHRAQAVGLGLCAVAVALVAGG
jgi:drug/metabolite transporter (DMT)-like permease